MEEKQNNKSSVIIILILVIAAGVFGFFYFKNLDKSSYSQSSDVALDSSLEQNSEKSGESMGEQITELKIEDLVVGSGAEAKSGNEVTVHYTGTLVNGTKFDSSKDRGTPFTFNLGAGDVIQGWDQGVPGMKVGGKRKLIIPSSLGYGQYGSPPVIGPNETLIFEVELLGVK